MRRGFTLLELLITVIIIGILASIAVPQFFSVAERARSAEGVSALGLVKSALMRYYAENGTANGIALSDLDYESTALKFFSSPEPGSAEYEGTDENLYTITRTTTSNPGYGTYVLILEGNGNIVCYTSDDSAKCPKGIPTGS